MKLKYYLRGLGIGIIVTAIIMSFTKKPEEITDAEIKARAAMLGMVEKNVLADIQENSNLSKDTMKEDNKIETVPEIEDTEKKEELINNLETEKKEETVENLETEKKEETVEDKETGKVEDAVNNINAEHVEKYIIITIEPGNGSETVCQKLLDAGLINSVKDYNKYLIQNGYDRSLRSGNHEIPVGATEEEMAKILCELD